MIFKLDYFYLLLGAVLGLIALLTLADRSNPRRYTTALFWALYATVYLAGEALPDATAGAIMIAMALLAGFGGVRMGAPKNLPEAERRSSAQRLGNKLFVPALIIPAVTMVCASVIAVAVACLMLRASPLQAAREQRRLVDAMGWAIVLPHMLAVLGLLFTEAGVGKAVAH
eukprot:gene35441-43699_t